MSLSHEAVSDWDSVGVYRFVSIATVYCNTARTIRIQINVMIIPVKPHSHPYNLFLLGQSLITPALTMRFSSFVGRRDDEKTKIAWCERIEDDRHSLILPTRQLSDRFENRIGPTAVAWCERVKDIRRINRPITDQSQ